MLFEEEAKKLKIPFQSLPAQNFADIENLDVPGLLEANEGGKTLYQYQRENVAFALARNGKCLIADEMGLGKTASAIVTTRALNLLRPLVICPKGAVNVWVNEIQIWGNAKPDEIFIISSRNIVKIPPNAKFVIGTYDQIIISDEWITLPKDIHPDQIIEWDQSRYISDLSERELSKKEFVEALNKSTIKETDKGWKIKLTSPLIISESQDLLGNLFLEKLKKTNARLEDTVKQKVIEWMPDCILVDESHRVKNASSKRAKAVREFVVKLEYPAAILITGTPLQNNYTDAKTQLSMLDPELGLQRLNEDETKEYLDALMIRHLLNEVRRDLPPYIYQGLSIDVGNNEKIREYAEAIDYAIRKWNEEVSKGSTINEAKREVDGLLTRARHIAGIMKAESDELLDQISMVVENHGSVVVFAHHHNVIDLIADRCIKADLTVAIHDGRTSQENRQVGIEAFGRGEVQVFIGSISTMESLSLVRANTAIFVEYDWVPTKLKQAEARIRRIGQTAEGCHVIRTLAKMDEGIKNIDLMILQVLEEKERHIAGMLGDTEKGVNWSKSILYDVIEKLVHDEEMLVPLN
jgi:SNF2 family DNA or RNA helicase